MTLSSDRPSGPVAAPQQVQCLCGHDAGSHNALKFNCMATTGGTHATRCGCKAFTDADRPSGQTPTAAGREMDALIAERVMGKVWRRFTYSPRRFTYSPFGVEHDDGTPWTWLSEPYLGEDLKGGEKRHVGNVEHYSRDIDAAWKVVEKMAGPGFHVDLRASGGGTYDCSWWVLSDDPEDARYGGCSCLAKICDAPTAPLAICLAALEPANHV